MKDKTIKGQAHIYYDDEMDVPFEYDDDFFSEKSTVFNKRLALVSMALTMSAFQTSYSDCTTGPHNLGVFLEQLKFKDFETNPDYYTKTESNTFGIGMARKKIKVNGKSYTLIAIGLRGNGYTSEWGGNFNVGESGAHAGFNICATKVINFLRSYIHRHHIEGNLKIWTTGFSRAAAGANMTGGYLDEIVESRQMLCPCTRLTKDDIYVYTFETPQGADAKNIDTHSTTYSNIFNILLRSDVVPLMGPSGMGFARYGNDCYLPCVGEENYQRLRKSMMKTYEKYAPSGTRITFLTKTFHDKFMFINADFESTSLIQMLTSKTSCDEYINTTMNMMTEEIGGRPGMITCQAEFSAILSDMLGANFQYAMATLIKICFAISKSPDKLFGFVVSKNKAGMIEFLKKIIVDTVTNMGFIILDQSQIEKLAISIEKYLSHLIHEHPSETITFLVNMPGIVTYHDPVVVLSWLMTLPEDYFK